MKQKITIAFSPDVSRALGNDIEAALFYQQMHYWSDKGEREDGFIYKTKKDIEEETTLSIKQQDRVRKKLEELGWIETKRSMVKGKNVLHYLTKMSITLNITKSDVTNTTKGQIRMLQKGRFEHDKRADSSITKITTKITTDILSGDSPDATVAPVKKGQDIVNIIEKFTLVSPRAAKMYGVPTWRNAATELITYAGGEAQALAFIDEFVAARAKNMMYLPVVDSLITMAARYSGIRQVLDKEKAKNTTSYNPKGNTGYKYQGTGIIKNEP
jgi:ferritin